MVATVFVSLLLLLLLLQSCVAMTSNPKADEAVEGPTADVHAQVIVPATEKDFFYRVIYQGFKYTSEPVDIPPAKGLIVVPPDPNILSHIFTVLRSTKLQHAYHTYDSSHYVHLGLYFVSTHDTALTKRAIRVSYGKIHYTLTRKHLHRLLGSEKGKLLEKVEFTEEDANVFFPTKSGIAKKYCKIQWVIRRNSDIPVNMFPPEFTISDAPA